MGDEMGGGGKDVGGRAVIAFELDDPGAGKILLEAQDVVHLGAAPAVNRLVIVTHDANIGLRGAVAALSEQAQPEILGGVGVLIFIDQHIAEAVVILLEDFGVFLEQPDVFEQQVAEIGGVEGFSRA